MATEYPKVFISHASEDKERFVIDFATKLRSRGVDAWVDKWEMLPGDSLIDKIFEEGIKNAQAMIIVLSGNSVQKPWVREELNTGMVKRISGKCKLIPVVIDDCEIPQALLSTVWERIRNLDDYEQELDRITSAIYGHTQKPRLGPPPQYAQLKIDNLPGLTHSDTLIFKTICETSLEIGSDWVNVKQFHDRIVELNISDDSLYESIEILAGNYFIEGKRTMGSRGLDFFRITTYGFETCAQAFLSEFDELVNQTLVSVVNHDLRTNDAIVSHLSKPKVLIDYVLDILARRDLIKISKTMGGGVHIYDITVKGQRTARNLHDE